MRSALIVIFILWWKILVAQLPMLNTPSYIHDYTNRIRAISLNGQPISFYLNHPKIDSTSKLFFKGELSLTQNQISLCLLDSILTYNSETRPFYFFIFNQIVDLSDGEMVDPVAAKCLEFVQKYPCDFFNAFNQSDIDINVVRWTTYIGLTLKERSRYADFKYSVDSKLNRNCSEVQDLWKSFLVEVRMCLVR